MSTPLYSLIIPIKDEEENIFSLFEEIFKSMQTLEEKWELIYIDDGSTDTSASKIKDLQAKHSFISLIQFDKNYGQSSAFDAGFQAAQGQYVISLDGDGQNDPKDIPKLLQYKDQADLICGWRKDRQDPWSKKIISKFANFFRQRLCQDYINDTGCSLKVYKTSCLRKIKLFHGLHRFLPALFKVEEFSVMEVPVSHRARTKGQSKYNFFNRSIQPFLDLFAVMWMRKRHLHYKIKP